MNKLFPIAIALALGPIGLASCSSEDYLGTPPTVVKAKIPILFNSKSSHTTRANLTGAEAASALGNEFRVFGTQTIGEDVTTPFDNYMVYYNGQVGDDPTNVAGWTYLSDLDGQAAYSKGPGATPQAVQFWDTDASRYDFVAFAGLPDDKLIVDDNSNTITADASNRGKIFFSNRVTATSEATSTGTTPNAQYGIPYSGSAADVLFTFYRLTSKIRCGIYETIPGYAVKNIRFYYDDNYLAPGGTSTKTTFGLRGTFPVSGDYTITYDANNDPLAAFSGTDVLSSCTLGELHYTTAASSLLSGGNLNADGTVSPTGEAVFIGGSANDVTFASTDAEEWLTILPYPNNPQRLVLRVDFDLVPRDGSQAIISIKGANAVVPLKYCQWRPNHAYTYIFKITDHTSGTTDVPDDNPPDPDNPDNPDGPDDPDNPDGPPDDPDNPNPPPSPGALFPITFDAQVSDIIDYSHEITVGE